LTKAQASEGEQGGTPGGVRSGVCRSHSTRIELIHEAEVEIELSSTEPTLQQQQAYEQFWRLFLERVLTERQTNERG
jgi:hypothetical protein